MSLSVKAKRLLAQGLADKAVGAEVASAIDAGSGADALGLGALSATGLIARTGAGASAARTLTGTTNQVTVTNGNGVSGNPTVSLVAAVNVTTSYSVGGTKVIGAQGAAVADSTDATTVIAQLNALLARLRAHGLIAP